MSEFRKAACMPMTNSPTRQAQVGPGPLELLLAPLDLGRLRCDRDRPSLGDSIIAQRASSCCAMGVTDGASVMRDTAFLREPIHAKSHATFDLNHLTIPSPIS